MSGGNVVVDWRSLREFADVDLTRSFVLSWYFDPPKKCAFVPRSSSFRSA
jgi:hypothetical protein